MSENRSFMFTSESVTEGHPDKVADAISDSILDAIIAEDKKCRVGCETLVTTGLAMVAGEITTDCYVDIPGVVRETIKEIGYNSSGMGFDWQTCSVITSIDHQSADIAMGVDEGAGLFKEQGAGDQGLMFGYACRETKVLMPAPIYLSHKILEDMATARHSGAEPGLLPDSKSQVTLKYVNGEPVGATSVVVSTQHTEDLDQAKVKEIVRPIVENVLPDGWMCPEDEFYVNPTGRFVIGGPDGDAGLTGRKIIVDTYGGAAPHGGGAFSGKDPTKVDRSAAYAARYLAKNVVAAGLADRCTIQLAYAIGVSKPLSVYVDMHDTGSVDAAKLEGALVEAMDLSPRGIREHLQLSRPIYTPSSSYGHFGRIPTDDGGFSWEKTDLVEAIKGALS